MITRDVLRQVKGIELRTRSLVNTLFTGEYRSVFRGQGIVGNLSMVGWRLAGGVPMRPGESLSLTVRLPHEQWLAVTDAVVRWSGGQEFAIELVKVEWHEHAWRPHDVTRLAQERATVVQ